ncbi:molybdopterin-dependent oxidoreductase [Marinobacter sp. BW6]|uniref:nitrate reductase n=1 Tax=Marinobacter sp. BW6 TaxID=2592624 RepID=UPI0011DEA74A|nr:nitrate reductase [Marinobacter sp. BW6]TYC56687.1 molybdopterin-dependent oxidoreductase [Marinobacter sp. BW6]
MTGTDKRPATVQTTCPYCGVGCGVNATPSSTAPDETHPANLGRLCVKGSALHETLTHDGRLLKPVVNGRESTWPQAVTEVARRIRESVALNGPGSVAFYLSGQLLTEDYYVANKLAKGFIRTPNVDTNSRLCMSSAVAAHKRAFGGDLVPGCYEDLELANLLVLAGSNAAWAHPVLYQRMQASARPGRRVVVIDPRKTATSDLADLHLAIRPGTDTVLFNGLLVWLADQQAVDHGYLADHCEGFDASLSAARSAAPSPGAVARICELPVVDVVTFFRWFAEEQRTVTAFSQGINQSSAGTDKGNAIINCHLATGRVGKPGASPFSLTGQPNAMGGREVGGLANTLAAHMDYDSPSARDRVARFWGSGAVAEGPGMKAVDLFDAVERGEIKVLWIMATNPAVSLPETHRISRALDLCPTVIVSDCVKDTDTASHADILLPAAGWGEKDGTVTNSERCISRQRRFLPLPGEARPDWWIISEVARALGHQTGFDYKAPADIFREHARLSGFENAGQRWFDISGLAELGNDQYEALEPVQWPVSETASDSRRLFTNGRFATSDGRARLVPIACRLPATNRNEAFPLIVNTGRIRDQWHTMTRTGRSNRLLAHRPEPFIEVHPEDIRALSLTPGALATLKSAHGHFVGRVRSAPEQRRGEVFVPIHWNDQFTGQGLATALTESVVDPHSGQPEAKYGRAALKHWPAAWYGRLLVRRNRPKRWRADYWSRQTLSDCDSWIVAGQSSVDWKTAVPDWLGGQPQLVMEDVREGRFRAARLRNGQVEAVLMVDRDPDALPSVDWLVSRFSQPELDEASRRGLLAAKAVDGDDAGNLVCSCFQVGDRQIQQAILGGANSVDALGKELHCGTNCGSCVPEIRSLLVATTEAV